jgi:hypothetical protein
MKNKITKRDVLFFIIGFTTLFLVIIAWDWENNIRAFKEGLNGQPESQNIESKD